MIIAFVFPNLARVRMTSLARARAWSWRAALMSALALLSGAATAREVTDSAGRKVTIPDQVARVMAAGPPASTLLVMLAPEKLVGWNAPPPPEELPYLPAAARNLPVVGRLTGRGNTADIEAVLAAKPDIIVDFGSIASTYVSLADRVQRQTGIPYLLIDGRFENTVAAMRLTGSILGVSERADRLAGEAQAAFDAVDRLVAAIPAAERPKVLLARRADGLETGNRGSLNTEIIERAGGVNVVDAERVGGGLVQVSIEQVLRWNPDTIIATDKNFAATAPKMTGWSQIAAVTQNRVFLSPNLPYGWIDAPLGQPAARPQVADVAVFPAQAQGDIRADAKAFYATFYQVELSADQLDRLIDGERGEQK